MTESPSLLQSRWAPVFAAVLLALAAFAVYANSLAGSFVYDDDASITDNLTLRHLSQALNVSQLPGDGATVSGRPVLNLSFALNYAWGGLTVRSYHVTNVLIHILAGLTLFGLVRRTLLRPALRARFSADALPLAFAVTAIWILHPVQTEAVTYIIQRAESLMSLFYLLTLYFFLRGAKSPAPWRWYPLAITACLFGMATKENMVSAPVLVLLFDRAFVAGDFATAWRQRRRFYLGLACTWIPLLLLVLSTGGNRGGSAGFDVATSWRDYTLTQFPALVRYLELALWPHPLVFDYGTFWVDHLWDVLPQALAVAALAGATLYALGRKPMLGFLGALVFAVLAPTSLMPGTTQMIVEHRLYLPLAPIVVAIVIGTYLASSRIAAAAFAALAVGLGCLTFGRNFDYRNPITLWQDTIAKRPRNALAHSSLGSALAKAGRFEEAVAEDQAALQISPNFVEVLSNIGNALAQTGRQMEAIPYLQRALHLKPDHATAHLNLGVVLDLLKQSAPALVHYEVAFRLRPHDANVCNDLGDALSRAGRNEEGIGRLEEAIQLRPDYVDAYLNLAAALARANRMSEAQARFETGIKLKTNNAEAYDTWATTLLSTGHLPEALVQYETALRLQPNSAVEHYNYANALVAADRTGDALTEFAAAVRLKSEYPEAQDNWGNTLLMLNRPEEAAAHYQEAVRLNPQSPTAQNNFGLALARLGRIREAAGHFETAVRLAPNYESARENLAHAQEELRE